MISTYQLLRFTRSFWLALGMLALFFVAFAFYVHAEKEIDRVNDIRLKSHSLAAELRQSSDDLTRMARNYVITGDSNYKDHYKEILAIRDGLIARPVDYHEIYWDLVLSDNKRPRPSSGEKIAFLDLMRRIGISTDEFAKLAEAKMNSDALALIEKAAFDVYESKVDTPEIRKQKAINLLTDDAYRAAKAKIMLPIADFHRMMEVRTDKAVNHAIDFAVRLRLLFILVGAVLIFVLWKSYQSLQFTLGGTVSELRKQLDKLGRAEFSESIAVPQGLEKSVLGLLSVAQVELARGDAHRRSVEIRNQRLTQFYNVLSQCNQAIVRSHSEPELFQQICRDTVQYAGIQMTWIGIVDTEKNVISVAAADGLGSDFLFDQLISTEEGSAFASDTPVLAAKDGRAHWCQDYLSAATPELWREHAEKLSWRAAASIPLFKNGSVYGVICLYSAGLNAFDEEIRTLLVELAMDLSFALNRFELEAGRQRSRKMEVLRSFMLERINSSVSLELFFHDVVKHLENVIPGSKCSILLLENDGVHIKAGATPSLSVTYSNAINGLSIGPGVGSCGHAMHSGVRVIVEDIATHPYWELYKDLALDAGLASCWSEPIRSSNNRILGAFAIYHSVPTKPDNGHLMLLEMAAHFLAIAIEKNRTESSLRKLSQAVEQSPNVIIITDTDAKIEYVNAAFVQKTGRTLEQVVGQRPSILQSGKTPLFSYEDMWDSLRRGENWQGELVNRYVDGKEYLELAHISPVRDVDGKITHFLSVQEDITDKKRTEERIQYLAHYDVLTGLPNRVLLEERARFAVANAKRTNSHLSLIFFDLDHFKNINDSLGHSTGDALLMELAQRLKETLREGDTISRLGGDEFILLLTGTDEHGAERVAEKLLQTVGQSYQIGQYDLNISASIGIAVYPEDGEDLETLLRNADTAMYRAKQDGRNIFRFFTQEMQARSGRHLELVNALRYALERNQFQVVYQPQISLDTGIVIGTEALLRWSHPDLGNVSPAEFIPVAEETGMIISIGEWVLRTAIEQTKHWHDMGWRNLGIAVNLSAIQFRHSDLPVTVTQILKQANMEPEFLELELTEGVAMIDPPGAIAIMNDLHQRGVRMSIDDFGTGYSSLSYLKKFKVYKLKIDQSFVRDISSDPEDKAIVSAVISMAQSLGLQTIAEGVETEEQLNFLREQKCDEVQGYYFARPLNTAQFEAFMRDRE
ncbi:EAL domain-containing protein [Undibacterium sp. LX40W]|uniref:EAL domain-containing protein n=1 Tax=Undibacterium nitidum TaxID=2762298 RepID=A0A923KT86_9BURK|nr:MULTISPECIES: EAL domain-containing protein [Undibacterium]MBC3881294.1 EAL domain-containing protein [Undibacterium nitidum]MBC3891923.1 EAL domain-containing protein [Undibacterium sp. LX40W]